MSLRYDQIKRKRSEGQDFWAAYADLYTMLSFVFLFLFAAANIRSGSQQLNKHLENVKLTKENEDLKEQIKVYSTIKDNYLEKKASTDEKQVYADLMDQLKLLEIENKQEADNLYKQANENQKKEKALNKYQQLIRNIVNTNILAKEQIQNRDTQIVKRETVIALKEKDIRNKSQAIMTLEQEVAQKEQTVAEHEAKIANMQDALKKKIAAIKAERKKSQITKGQMQKQIDQVTFSTQKQIGRLAADAASTKNQLDQVKGQLSAAEGEVEAKNAKLQAAQGEVAAKSARLQAAEGEVAAKNARLQAAQGEVAAKNAKLAEAEGGRQRALASVENLKKSNQSMSADLERAKAMLKAKQDLVGQIQSEFAKSGIHAQVDGKTGDVTLDFGDEYFETNSAALKPGMVKRLSSFFPAYSEALFKDKNLSQKLANVEIIGFSSPTYMGRYINPSSIKSTDREAILYNLKLSFNRANEIFKYAFDNNKVQFSGQKSLLPLIKVVSRGYLPEGISGNDIPEGTTERQFCAKYNCKKAQRVVIKFNLRE